MESAVALGAIRRITIDVANLTGQLAISQAGIEFVRQVAMDVNPEEWQRAMQDDDAGHPEMIAKLNEDQISTVMRLLAALDALE